MLAEKKATGKRTTKKPAAAEAPEAAATSAATASDSATASESIDQQLAKYRSMRDFSTTAEPSGGHGTAQPASAMPFVIQKHAATRLHYDFRLGWHGVLKSWAVAKGPSYVVADKRLAVQVEDHPMEYGGFEGTIPKGQYGGGTVMLWDEGTWEPVGDGDEGFRTGRLKFVLHGRKLRGKWTLIRMGGKAAQEAKPNWLLIKEHDEFERPASAPAVTDEEADSVITGRDLAQIAAAEDHVWDSRTGLAADARNAAAAAPAKSWQAAGPVKGTKNTAGAADLSAYPKTAIPGFVEPQLAAASTTPPAGTGWVHELKLDGYRMQAHLAGGRANIYSRNGLDWTARVRGVCAAVEKLPVENAIVDGEVVALDEKGLSSFSELQSAFDENKPRDLMFYCFDLLYLDGHDLRGATLLERKTLLHTLLNAPGADQQTLRYSEHLEVDGARMFQEACALGAEGIVSKRKDAQYAPGRHGGWSKTKCIRQQEFVIGGYTLQANHGGNLGALLLGYYRDSQLIYAGRTGTGFTQSTQKKLLALLKAREQKVNPFEHVPGTARKGALWLKPELVAEVHFREWTGDGMVRQAAFKGLREDKPAADVKRERATPGDEAVSDEPLDAPASASSQKKAIEESPKKTPKETATPAARLTIRLTHPDKVIDAASGLTKQTLAGYYDAVAERMLPHISHRPLSIVRCPDGSTGQCFFQKHVKVGLPKGVGSVEVPDKKTGKPEEYITLSTKEALVGMAQMNVLELHPWGSCNAHLEEPDRLVFDLDPDENLAWEVLAESAEEVRKRLAKLGLKSFLKGTGGKGLHIVAPLTPEPGHDWPLVKAFAHAFVQKMEMAAPQRYLTKMTKSARTGKIYLDYLRNERGATAVAAWSPRRRAGVPASVPFAWSVLKEKARPKYAVAHFEQWLSTMRTDVWKDLPHTEQTLTRSALEAIGS